MAAQRIPKHWASSSITERHGDALPALFDAVDGGVVKSLNIEAPEDTKSPTPIRC
jgi:hypothetical protein